MTNHARREREFDDGFGMIEIIVSMMLLMVVALSMLPIFVSSLRLAAENVSLTTATQLVGQQLDEARRGIRASCVAIQGWAAQTTGMSVEDPRGVTLDYHRTAPATCPTSYPAAISVTAWVTVRGDPTGTHIAEAETRIHIEQQG